MPVGGRGANGGRSAPGMRPGMAPGTRGGKNVRVGRAGMDSRGVFGTRASKTGGVSRPTATANGKTVGGAKPVTPSAGRGTGAPGVRAPRVKSGGEQLNRGVIRGAKGSTAQAAHVMAPKSGGRKKDDKDKDLYRDVEENAFALDHEYVPGVIRGYTPPKEQEHVAGPTFGERPGKRASNKKKFDFDDDDW